SSMGVILHGLLRTPGWPSQGATSAAGRGTTSLAGGRGETRGALETEALAVRPVPRALHLAVEAELLERVAVRAVLVLRVLGEEAPHASLDHLPEGQVEVAVDAPDGGDRIAYEIRVHHVEESLGGHRARVARGERAANSLGPARRGLGAGLCRVDRVAERAPQRRVQARHRRHD